MAYKHVSQDQICTEDTMKVGIQQFLKGLFQWVSKAGQFSQQATEGNLVWTQEKCPPLWCLSGT